jgi:hypothetical protein
VTQQVSVFLENKPGRLEKVTAILKEQKINIRAITLSTSTAGWGVLNLLVNRPEAAWTALREAGHPAALRDILVVNMPDVPGALHDLLAHLKEAGINVQNAYGSVLKKGEAAILVIDVDDVVQAKKLLAASGVATLSAEQVYEL